MGMVRLQDVAAQAGVAKSTASYVLGGKAEARGISPETSRRVEQVARDLGYVRNAAAHTLRHGRTQSIMVFYAPPLDRFLERFVLRAVRPLAEVGYQLTVVPVTGDAGATVAAALKGGACDGAVIGSVGAILPDLREHLPRPPVPTIVLGTDGEDVPGYDCALTHESDAVAEALERILAGGSSCLAMACSTSFSGGDGADAVRWDAYVAATTRHGHAPDLLMSGPASTPAAFEAALPVLSARRAAGDLPDAVYCDSDRMALGILMASRVIGIQIPDEMSVIGTGNSDEGQALNAPLTSIGMGDDGIDAVVTHLLARLSGELPTSSAIDVRWRLFARSTTRID